MRLRKKKKPNARAISPPIMAHPIPMPAAAPDDTPLVDVSAPAVAVDDADELDDGTDDSELAMDCKEEAREEVEVDWLVTLEVDSG